MPLSSLPVIGSDGAFLLQDDEGGEAEASANAGGGGGDESTRAAAAASAPGPTLLSSSMPLRSLLSCFLVGSSGGRQGGTAVSVVRQGSYPRAKAVAHRVALLSPKKKEGAQSDDEGQRVTHIVSQLDAARFVLKHASILGPLALKTAAELGAFFSVFSPFFSLSSLPCSFLSSKLSHAFSFPFSLSLFLSLFLFLLFSSFPPPPFLQGGLGAKS